MNILQNYRKLKAFTLAEILVVLTVIGVIATITIPQLTAGVDEAQFKAGFKKAFTTMANVAAILKSDDELPTASDTTALYNVWRAIDANIEVDGYVLGTGDGSHGVDCGTKLASATVKPAITYNGNAHGEGTSAGTQAIKAAEWAPWIVAADGMAYTAITGGASCGNRQGVNAPGTTAANAVANSCVLVVVDVNGLGKLPNKIEAQVKANAPTKLKRLTGDRYYIYITKNGIAKGSEDKTVSGRLLAGQK